MKLEIFDLYHLRARVCPEIIVLAPVAITLLLCLGYVFSIFSSSVIVLILIAFANFLPIMQRRNQSKRKYVNYAAEMLYPSEHSLDEPTKARYYKILASENEDFSSFLKPEETQEFKICCESAVAYLRERSRDNKLVKEENINYGFYRNLLARKRLGIILCLLGAIFSAIVLSLRLEAQGDSVYVNCIVSICFNVLLLVFWLAKVNEDTLQETGKEYALTLLRSIEMLKKQS